MPRLASQVRAIECAHTLLYLLLSSYRRFTASCPTLATSRSTVSAQRDAAGKVFYARIVNKGTTASSVSITLRNAPAMAPAFTTWTLVRPAGGPASNPPTNPTAISPTQATVAGSAGRYNVSLPASSFVIIGVTTA